MTLLASRLEEVNAMALAGDLPDVDISDKGVKITPLDNSVPSAASPFGDLVYGMLPHPKITEMLDEVDGWTGFTRHFTHLKNNHVRPKDRKLLLTTILADDINLGLTKMAESCPGTTKSSLEGIQAWYIRDETYSAALAELVNAQKKRPLAAFWGDGTTSSSDGQNFRVGNHGRYAGQVNLKYGQEPGVQIYTHISDQYSPFYTKVISRVRDSTHVLDGLLYHETDLDITEHYTDTAGFTEHVNEQNTMYDRGGSKRKPLKRQPVAALCLAHCRTECRVFFMLLICRSTHYFCFCWPALMPERRGHAELHAQKRHRQAIHQYHTVKHREQKFAQGISTCG